MPVDNNILHQLLERQAAELDRYTAEYVRTENETYSHMDGVDYNRLDTAAKAAYTRKLNELTKARDELVEKIHKAQKRLNTTKSLVQESQSEESLGNVTHEMRTYRIPTMPTFRGTKKDSTQDAFEFIDQCKSLLEAHDVPQEKWLKAIKTALTSIDRQWVSANLEGKEWDDVEREFLDHFESPVLKDKLNRELMSISVRKNETVQQYSDRFTSLMRRTGKRDDDSSLIPVYINGLDNKLQEMINVARATHLAIWSQRGESPKVSVNSEVQIAIGLDAARTNKRSQNEKPNEGTTNDNAVADLNRLRYFRGKCNTCGRYGHKARDHSRRSNRVDQKEDSISGGTQQNRNKNFALQPQLSSKAGEGKSEKAEKKSWTCKGPWRPGHKCDGITKQHNNMQANGADDDKSFGDRVAELIMNSGSELGTLESGILNSKLIHTPVIINGIEGTALVDSGADTSFISKDFVQRHSLKVKPERGIINGGTGTSIGKRLGTVAVEVRNGERTIDCNPDVIKLPPGRDLVIGLPQFKDFGYKLSRVPVMKPGQKEANDEPMTPEEPQEPSVDGLLPADLSAEVEQAVRKNQSIPLSSRCEHPLAVLRIKPRNTEPIWRQVNFVQPKHTDRVTGKVHEWLASEVIEPAPEHCVNCFSLLTVPKKDAYGNKTDIRPCLDLRPLNPRIPDLIYPLPKIHEVLDSLGSVSGSETLYSTIDIRDGYFRFRIPPEDRNWIAFMWKGVHYRFTCAPFGVKTMTSLFQRVMDKIFGNLHFAKVYVDDITVFSNNRSDHVHQVCEVIRRLTKWNIPIRVNKSRFGQRKVRLLGFVVSGRGIEMDEMKIEAIRKWPAPKTHRQLLRFLGSANYYRQFVRNFSMISHPLDKERTGKGRLTWTADMESAFQKLKDEICKGTLLSYPDDNKKYHIGTDASDYGLGAWIAQRSGNRMNILGFASRSLSSSERRYSPTKKELLAVIFALKKFETYISGKKFTLQTDHKALVYIFTQKHVHRMITEWFNTLLSYDFDVVHVPGCDNTIADALSRTEEPANLMNITIDHLIRDKKQPEKEGERRTLIERAHNFGHFGQQEVFMKLWNDGYWWKNIRKDIACILSNCAPCQRYNVQKRGFHPLRSVMAELPWDHIAVDLVSPLPMTKNGEDTLLVVVDIMTKFAVLKCLKGKNMAQIAQALWEVMSILGVPKIIQSDNGTDFVNQLIQELVQLNGIDHRTISPYNPRANGAVERVNGIIERMLKKELQGAMYDWADCVPYVNLAYNEKISSLTGSTPFSLMFGRRLNAFENYGPSTKSTDLNLVLWKKRTNELHDVIYPAVNERALEKKERMISDFAKRNRIISEDYFPQGAQVMMVDKTKESKWDPTYEGVFTIVRRNRGGAYVLKDRLGELLKRAVPADQLKLVHRHGEAAAIRPPSYEIREITDHRYGKNRRPEYFVVWKDKNLQRGWEPVENFDDINVIKKYWKRVRPTRRKE